MVPISERRRDRAPQRAASAARLARLAVLLGFAALVVALMVTDVWDETRGLQLIRDHSVVELVRSNWTAGMDSPVVLFRPLPMVIVTVVAKAAPSWETAWRALRMLVAGALVTAVMLLLAVARQTNGGDPWRDATFAAGVLLAGSGVLAAAWFAMAFDVFALLLVAAGTLGVLRRRPIAGGVLLAAALLCKESALIALPVVALVVIRSVPRAQAWRAALTTAAGSVVALGLRFAVVLPGSAHDLHALSITGMLTAATRLPALVWWQLSDPPSVALGWVVFGVFIAALGSRRAAAAATGSLLVAALLYGQMVHVGASPLLDANQFAGRLYLLPGAVLLLLAALSDRRWLPVLLLVPLLWGGAVTARRQLAFQHAYQQVQRLAEERPDTVRVDCKLYRRPFLDRRRGLELGRFADAPWQLQLDGTLVKSPDG